MNQEALIECPECRVRIRLTHRFWLPDVQCPTCNAKVCLPPYLRQLPSGELNWNCWPPAGEYRWGYFSIPRWLRYRRRRNKSKDLRYWHNGNRFHTGSYRLDMFDSITREDLVAHLPTLCNTVRMCRTGIHVVDLDTGEECALGPTEVIQDAARLDWDGQYRYSTWSDLAAPPAPSQIWPPADGILQFKENNQPVAAMLHYFSEWQESIID